MHTATLRHLVARTFRVLTQTSSVLLLGFSATVTAATAGSESTPLVQATQSIQASPAAAQPARPPGGAVFDSFSAANPDERPHADPCSEATLTGNASTAHCDAVIYALSERELNADQSWELAAALNNRALSRNRTQDTEGAIGDLTLAIDVMPRWAELYVNRGNLYLKSAAHAAALADYEQALLLSGGRLDAVLFNRAFVERALGQPKRAEAELLLWQATLLPAVPDATEETVEPVSGGR